MIPLLYFALADTVIADYPDESVFIHEMAVIEIDEVYLELESYPGNITAKDYFQDHPREELTAPVVFFHGEECSGTFSVEICGSHFTTHFPYPDSIAVPGPKGGGVYTAVWEDLRITRDPPVSDMEFRIGDPDSSDTCRRCHIPEYIQLAVSLWQRVPANRVHYGPLDYTHEFLYYEVIFDYFEMFMGDFYNYEGDALIFSPEDGEMTCILAEVPGELDTWGVTLTDQNIMAVLCDWGHNGLKTEEISALWNTWKPVLRYRCEQGGQVIMLFPLSEEQANTVSRIRFVPERNGQLVRYDRLFLGLGPLPD